MALCHDHGTRDDVQMSYSHGVKCPKTHVRKLNMGKQQLKIIKNQKMKEQIHMCCYNNAVLCLFYGIDKETLQLPFHMQC